MKNSNMEPIADPEEMRFLGHPGARKALCLFGAAGANPFYVQKLLWLISNAKPVEAIADELKAEANRLSRAAQALEDAATYLSGTSVEGDLDVSVAKLRGAAEQIREIFLPVQQKYSGAKTLDSYDYMYYGLYAYLTQFRRRGVYSAIASLVEAALYDVDLGTGPIVSPDAAKKRIFRFKKKHPEISQQLAQEQCAYVQAGNGGYDLRQRIEKLFAEMLGCDLAIVQTRLKELL